MGWTMKKDDNLSKFMGWYQIFTGSELISLSAINTGKIYTR